MRRYASAIAVLCAAVVLTGPAHAAIPQLIGFEGRLCDSAGDPIAGAVDVAFSLHDAATAGTELWTETHAGLTPDAEGIFSLALGSVTTFASSSADFRTAMWLEVQVGTEALSPRFALRAAPYALAADHADTVDGQHASSFVGKAGATMTGDLILAGDPTATLHAATKGYVDGRRPLTWVSGILLDETDSGPVPGRVLDFVKVHDTSILKITYSDNIRLWTTGLSAEWEVLIDGASIASPCKLSMAVYEGVNDNNHRQSTLVGIATGIASGPHQITVQINPLSGSPDAYTGWNSTFTIIVEEIE